VERIPIDDGRKSSHLAVRLDLPETPGDEATAVLYVHGFASSQAGEKAAFFRRRLTEKGLGFCSFDLQGHGESGGSLFDLTLSRNLADIGRVHGLLAARGLRRLILFGSSMGGGSALWYAAFHPDDVAAAVLIAPSMEMDKGLLERIGPEAARRWQSTGRHLFEHELGSAEIGWDLIEDLRSFRLERLQAIYRTPTLIFQGKRDESVSWRSVVDFAMGCSFENLTVHLMADAGHRLIDRLESLGRLTEEFLAARGLLGEALIPAGPVAGP